MNQRGSRPRESLPAAPNAAGDVYQVVAVCGLLLLAVGLVFGQTVHHEFINLDDNVNVYLNPHVTGGLTAEAVKWAFTDRYMGVWMPLTWISHMVDCQIHGLDAGGHHLTNVLLHAATAVLLFLVLRRMTGRMWPSALVAAAFAVHPLRAESVAWVTERKDVLSGLFFVAAVGAYVGYARHRFSLVRYVAVLVLFGLGLMAKPMLVTLPFVLLLLDYWPLGRWTATATNKLVLEKVPLLALAASSCLVTTWAYRGDLVHSLDQGFPLSWRIGNAAISCVNYLGMFFYPGNLATAYPLPGPDLSPWEVLAAVLILVVVTTAALVARRRHPYLLVGWLWYLGMLVPVSGILQFGMQTMADRFTYLPQIGLCLALVWGLADALASWPRLRPVCGAVAVLLLAVLTVCGWRQASFWRDNLTLWTRTLACTAPNKLAHNSLGNAYLDLRQVDKAIDQYQTAIAIDPDYAMSHYNLGVGLAATGRLDQAMEEYETAVRLQPTHALAHNNLGNALLAYGRLATAMDHCQEALRIDPQFAEAHYNVGAILYSRGQFDEAIAELQHTLEANPNFAAAHFPLGLAFAQRGRFDEAIEEYRKALEKQPYFLAEIHNSLALALAARGRPDDAVVHYRKALAIRPDFIEARLNLTRALAGRDGSE
jgi:protein O-mannosyl-transferase